MSLSLRAARVDAKLSQREAAKSIGVSIDTIGKWERGACAPNARYIPAIEASYGRKYDELIFCDKTTVIR